MRTTVALAQPSGGSQYRKFMNQSIKQKFDTYPVEASVVIQELRALIYQVAEKHQLGDVTESLKWGEPSYSVVGGSPIRIDWKPRSPNSVSLFFNCKTNLVDTFREIYADSLKLIGNRELCLEIAAPLPKNKLSHCILLAQTYHKIKSLPLLGG